jgi:hypothetical protein
MFWQHRKLTADELAREFSVTAQAFSDGFIQYVAAGQSGESPEIRERRHAEACALILASIEATFMASALTQAEREKVVPRVRESLSSYWCKYSPGRMDFVDRVKARACVYLQLQDELSQLKTATRMILELAANLDADAATSLPTRTLTALLAHRMLADSWRLNEIKAGFSIS